MGGYFLISTAEEFVRMQKGVDETKIELSHGNLPTAMSNFGHDLRRLNENDRSVEFDECLTTKKVDSKVLLIPYGLGVLYMFFAIAIVCDEFFVPALEEIASENYLNLSMDVAGATLMAAGGSTPELFTSMIGTFQGSEIGFGTIVGSAVFNVLFVIGMCAVFSKDTLTLTWWPLFRDCSYYAVGLSTLAIFCGYSSPGEIESWEAIVLFLLYIGYVVLMKFNETLASFVKKLFSKGSVSTDESVKVGRRRSTVGATKTSTFRVGLLNVFTGKGSIGEKVGITMVSKISGNVGAIFRTLDVSGDGFIDKNEFNKLVDMLGTPLTLDEIETVISELDDNGDGQIDLKEFTKWYITSETSLKKELHKTFHNFAIDGDKIDGHAMRRLLKELGTEVNAEDINAALEEANILTPSDKISFDTFEAWYTQSKYWERHLTMIDTCTEEVVEPVSNHLKIPTEGGVIDYLRWIFLLPIILSLCLSVPDVRQPGNNRLCFFAFILSILWIGCFTYFMVNWAEVIGNTLGIPIVLMGLTILAAGTSVPDLLSSVIVARMGEGDMAVSSSIGSNIFDITVGLPIPWLLFYIVNKGEKSITVSTKMKLNERKFAHKLFHNCYHYHYPHTPTL